MSDLYRAELLDTYKNPTYMGSLPNADLHIEAVNKFCGDTLVLELNMEGGKVADARFSGEMCMVSQVSADLILDELIGKELRIIDKETVLKNFGNDLTTSRVKCALLIKNAVESAVEKINENK